MDKRGMSKFSAVVIILLFIVFSFYFVIAGDANNIWVNYGQETIGVITLTEPLNNPGISLEKTEEVMPSASIPSSNVGGSGGVGSVTNVYNTYVTKTGEGEKEKSNANSNKDSIDNQINKETGKANAGITGAIIGSVEKLLSGRQISFIITILCGTFVIFIIFRYKTTIRIKKK
jgi:hypothetical protein